MKCSALFFLTAVLLLTACGEDFLDLAPRSQNSAAQFYKTAEDMEQAVAACYDALQSTGQYGKNFTYFMEVNTDNATLSSVTNKGGIYGEFELFRVAPANPVLNETWKDCYRGIQLCNIVLGRIDGTTLGDALKPVRKGEVKFIRALTYFNLVRIWGAVPLVTAEVKDPFEAFAHERNPVDDIYWQIILDLEQAIEALPATLAAADIGRVSQGAAQTLLAKVLLTRKDYAGSIKWLDAVIAARSYSLLTDYNNLFTVANKNHAESIFEIQFLKGGYGEGSAYANSYAPLGDQTLTGGVGASLGENLPTRELLNVFEPGDRRKAASIDSVGKGNLYNKKFLDKPFQDGDAGNNFMLLRYADVLLMNAEARNEAGYEPNGKAFAYLNAVRERAGLPALAAAQLADQATFRLAVEQERRCEFAFENHRWFDLVRTGRALNVLQTKNGGIQAHQLLFPVPQVQIDTNPGKITQNKDY